MRPNFPHEFTEKQKAAMLPYGPSLRRISHLVDWLRYNLLHEDRKEFRETLAELRDRLNEVEVLFSSNTGPPGAKS
jgi:hypothetical protein